VFVPVIRTAAQYHIGTSQITTHGGHVPIGGAYLKTWAVGSETQHPLSARARVRGECLLRLSITFPNMSTGYGFQLLAACPNTSARSDVTFTLEVQGRCSSTPAGTRITPAVNTSRQVKANGSAVEDSHTFGELWKYHACTYFIKSAFRISMTIFKHKDIY
jgi:hypothetical protein